MKRGGKFLASATVLAVAACGGSEQANLKVRPIPTPLAQGTKPVPFRIAEARGQLALGNVALALEAFRMAVREDPTSIDAMAGIATCYDRMGRYDLSRRNYEAALALAPANVELLGLFAQSLQLQGQIAEAARVRDEIALRLATAEAAESPALAERAPLPAPAEQIAASEAKAARVTTTVPMALAAPAPMIVAQAAPVEVAIPRPTLTSAQLSLGEATAPVKTDVALPNLPDARIVEEAPIPAPAVAPQRVEQAAIGSSVTIKLPPARRIEAAASPLAARPAEAPKPVMAAADLPPPMAPYIRPIPKPAVVEEQGPRLERLTLGEIGLITAPGPVWRTTTLAKTDISSKLRFVPLREATSYPVKVRLLNAARVDRLAARTRAWLTARGWRGLAIGDARTTRSRSMIYYPASQRALAQRLSAQFGFALAPRVSGAQITVLLGTDAARHPALKPRRA